MDGACAGGPEMGGRGGRYPMGGGVRESFIWPRCSSFSLTWVLRVGSSIQLR